MKIGDKVRFIDEMGGGTVLRIEGKTAIVADADGFEIPALAANLVVVNDVRETTNYPASYKPAKPAKPAPAPVVEVKRQEEEEVLASEKADDDSSATSATPMPERDAEGSGYEMMLAFLQPKDEHTELYLLNDSPYRLLYSVGLYEHSGTVMPIAQGIMEGDSMELLKAVPLSSLRMVRTLRVELLLYKNIGYTPQSVEPLDVELKPVKFFSQGAFTENEFFEEHALIYKILSNRTEQQETPVSIDADAMRESMLSAKVSEEIPAPAAPAAPEIEEVNLHAESLVPTPSKLTAGELLELQLAHFERTLNSAIASQRSGKIVYIHGLGSGVLKQEIRRRIERDYPDLKYRDASFKEYGYGATMVTL